MYNLISKNFYELIYYNMKEFNMKQWLTENKSGMYSKTVLTENQLIKVLRDLYYFDKLNLLAA